MKFSIYRYNPETDSKPRMQGYELPDDCGAIMLLDALLLLKQQDDSLSFRRSCREGVCGSDGMNINGRNGLACILQLDTLKQPITLRPLTGSAGDPRPDCGFDPVLQSVPDGKTLAHQ